MSKPPVLCITKSSALDLHSIGQIKEEDLHFINRGVVDNKEDITIGELFPQIIPSVALQAADGTYLTYARKGNETRLHGSRSMTVGGHIDLEDFGFSLRDTILNGANRELLEECGLRHYFEFQDFTNFIYLPVDNVSKVHLGLFTKLGIKNIDQLTLNEELYDVQFLTKEQLIKDIDLYEAWSKHIISTII